MAPVDASAILGLWEGHRGLDAISRSVALSAAAEPVVSSDVALDMPIGERNTRLLQLRLSWAEAAFEATATCPDCGTTLEFSVDPAHLIASASPRNIRPISVGDRTIHWRPVDSHDLLRAATEPDDGEAQQTIIRGCVQDVFEDGIALADYKPTDTERASLAEAIEKADPLCDLVFELNCVECGGPVAADLQVPDVVWEELESMARELVSQVHTLASAYGWTETDCLALSPSRRATYLEAVGAR